MALPRPDTVCAQTAPRYTVADLGSFGAGAAEPTDINNNRQIVGWARVPGTSNTFHAFRTNGGPIDPATDDLGIPAGIPAGGTSIVQAMNDRGQAVAEAIPPNSSDPIPPFRSYLVSAGGRLDSATDIGTLGGVYTYSHGINESGQIVGRSGLAGDSPWHAFLYTAGASMRDLGSLGGPYSEAFDVNDLGQVVGTAEISTRSPRAFRTGPNSTIQPGDNLGTLGGDYSHARAINNRGQVAGMSSNTGEAATHIFRTAPNAPINPATDDLGALPGSTYAEPFDMNEAGDIVGWSQMAGGTFHAFLVRGSTLYDLNNLMDPAAGYTLVYASAINDRGEIVAAGVRPGQNTYTALLLTPVPEPGAGLAVLLGAALLRRRRAS
jgi:MYXO-CTERM domain-containing protein